MMPQVDRDRLVSTFLELVQINATSRHERPVVDFIKSKLARWQLPWFEDDAGKKIGGDAGNLIVTVAGAEPPQLFLCAHTDTVRPTERLKPQLQNGIVRSDGTTILGADNRAGVAVLLYLLQEIAENGLPHRPFEIAFTVAEEVGLLGAANLDFERLQSPSGYIFDSSLPPGDYISVTPTALELKIDLIGKPAHAGVAPEKGINAVSMAAEVLARFPVGRVDHQTVANIGRIRGGEATNVVPGEVHMEGEIRSFNRSTLQKLVGDLQQALEEVSRRYGGRYRLEPTPHFEGFEIPEDHELTRRLKEKMRQVGLTPAGRLYHGGSDANIFNARGRTAINLGIGARNPHGNDEHIAVADLIATARLAMALVAPGD